MWETIIEECCLRRGSSDAAPPMREPFRGMNVRFPGGAPVECTPPLHEKQD